jgi:hypothetical protein
VYINLPCCIRFERKKGLRASKPKSRYKKASSNDLCRVEETEREIIVLFLVRYKPNHWEARSLEAEFVFWLGAEPADKEKWHPLHSRFARFRVRRRNVCMVDPKDPRIPVGLLVLVILTREDHDIGVCGRIDGVIVSSIIVSRVVDLAGTDLVDFVAVDGNRVPVLVREFFVIIAVEITLQSTAQQVILQFGDEALSYHFHELQVYISVHGLLTSNAGSPLLAFVSLKRSCALFLLGEM